MMTVLRALFLSLVATCAMAANEVGYWAGGAGGSTQLMFVGGGGASVASLIYVAPSNGNITHVRAWRASGGGATANFKIALFAVTSGHPTSGSSPLQSVTINNVVEGVEFGADVTWPVTSGTSYILAVEPLDGAVNISAGTLTNGCEITSQPFNGGTGWTLSTTTNVRLELAADFTASSSGFVNPVKGPKGSLGGPLGMNPSPRKPQPLPRQNLPVLTAANDDTFRLRASR